MPLSSQNQKIKRSLNEYLLQEVARIANKDGFILKAKFAPKKRFISGAASISDVVILIQGPISTVQALGDLKETVKIYTSSFPGAQIVLSTWESSLTFPDGFLKENNVNLVLTKDPGTSWPNNLTRQMLSTRNGLNAMKISDETMVVKTRTDQRFSNPLALDFMHSMIREYPGKGRVWTTDYGTGRYRLYGISDQLQFGYYRDLLNYWNATSVEELHKIVLSREHRLDSEIAKMSIAVHEILLAVNYLHNREHHVLWSWEDHLFCLKNYFGVINSSFIGLELLSRGRTPIDHVLPGMSEHQVEIEHHLSAEEWFLALIGSGLPNPEPSLLMDAMKVPRSDQILVQKFWSEKDNM